MVNYSRSEERANAYTHAAGIVLGIVAGCVLLAKAATNSGWWATGSVLAYLFGMLSSYVSSTCYHACNEPEMKKKLRKFDHAAIYLHIAGTYVPFSLVVLRNEGLWGWGLFGITTLAAIIGVALSFGELKKHSHIKTVCYVLMGCCILIAIKPLSDVLNRNGQIDALYWLIGGGVSYIVGALFYSWTKKIYAHTVFHLFVLGGSVCHIIAIYKIL